MNPRAGRVQSSSQPLYPTAALVGYKIALFRRKCKSVFEKSSPNRAKIRYFVTTHKIESFDLAKVIKQALLRWKLLAKRRADEKNH